MHVQMERLGDFGGKNTLLIFLTDRIKMVYL